ncbi:N-terminal methylation site-containing protein [Hathewaya proteolytica DSM 3090]|uniref:N-terminal methylation site-containing protein n=1 Tax=Hathewaya proteolytica DSM 3090 TaxID=1121331 RepID=A0A1M6LHM5_9CLOT|nr:type II secretion system protein [Hathewaya proteolytica]SHJ70684.1 N-terminal methylation site-containing protein [Hathewaya proteolytica DSM 3090]
MKKKGFTLIEIIVVLAIMGIIMAIAVPSVSESYKRKQQSELEVHKVSVNKAIRQYYALEGEYPATISDLEKDSSYGTRIDRQKYNYTYNPLSHNYNVGVTLK